jgi:hypothetical protein
MACWALGSVVESLVTSEVARETLPSLHLWREQLVISKTVCLEVFVVVFFGPQEPSAASGTRP